MLPENNYAAKWAARVWPDEHLNTTFIQFLLCPPTAPQRLAVVSVHDAAMLGNFGYFLGKDARLLDDDIGIRVRDTLRG